MPIKNRAIVELGFLSVISLLYCFISLKYFQTGFVDDTYITLRYAQHLADGAGLAWNIGEGPVEGFTCLSWVVLLALIKMATGISLETIALFSGVGCGFLTLWLSWFCCRKIIVNSGASSIFSLIVPLHLALTPLFYRHAVSGMETMMTALLLMLICIIWCYLAKSKFAWLMAALVTFLATLTRPDAALFGLSGLCKYWFSMPTNVSQKKRQLFLFSLSFAGLLVVYLLWKLSYFHSVIPLSAYMKIGGIRILQNVHMANFVLGHAFGFLSEIAPLVFLYLLALRLGLMTGLCDSAMAVASLAYSSFFLTVLPVMSFEYRFLYPLYPVICVLGGSALILLLRSRTVQSTFRPLSSALLITIFCLYNIGELPEVKQIVQISENREIPPIAKALASVPDITIAWGEAGQLPYFSQHRFIDIAGLNDVFIAKNRFSGKGLADSFQNYLLKTTKLPDLYFQPHSEYKYARMENMPLISPYYEQQEAGGFPIFVLKTSAQRQEILAAFKQAEAQMPKKHSPKSDFWSGIR